MKYQVGDILVKHKGTQRVLTIVKIYPTTQIVVYDNVNEREEKLNSLEKQESNGCISCGHQPCMCDFK